MTANIQEQFKERNESTFWERTKYIHKPNYLQNQLMTDDRRNTIQAFLSTPPVGIDKRLRNKSMHYQKTIDVNDKQVLNHYDFQNLGDTKIPAV